MTIRYPEHLERLNELVTGYQKSQLLFAAVSSGLVDHLAAGTGTVDELVAATGLARRPVRVLLDALAALEVLEREDGRYRLAAWTRDLLAPDSPQGQSAMIRHHQHLATAWATLPEVLRTGAPADGSQAASPEGQGQGTDRFIHGMRTVAATSAPALLASVDLSACRTLLDLGGGPAVHSIALAREYPGLRVTVFDKPDVIRRGREFVAEAGLAERIRFVEGDFRTDDIGNGYDFILISNVLHIFADHVNAELLVRCAAALNPGGRVAVKELFVDSGRRTPAANLVFAMTMLVSTDSGEVYSADDVRRWCRSAGLVPEETTIRLSERSGIVLARKPV